MSHNKKRNGGSFEEDTVRTVWEKLFYPNTQYIGLIIALEPTEKGSDKYGNEIHYCEYGNTNSKYGWEVDHIKPQNRGGSDDLFNLQALQWRENRIKGDTYPYNK